MGIEASGYNPLDSAPLVGVLVLQAPTELDSPSPLVTKGDFFSIADASGVSHELAGRCWSVPHSAWEKVRFSPRKIAELEAKSDLTVGQQGDLSVLRNELSRLLCIDALPRLFSDYDHMELLSLQAALASGLTEYLHGLGSESNRFYHTVLEQKGILNNNQYYGIIE